MVMSMGQSFGFIYLMPFAAHLGHSKQTAPAAISFELTESET
jgi:hypothetical protein